MKIDLKKPDEPTASSVRALLASGDDSRNSQLRVTLDGIAFLSNVVGNKGIENLSFRLETFAAGNGNVGFRAAQNTSWVDRIVNVLRSNWPNPTSTYIDFF